MSIALAFAPYLLFAAAIAVARFDRALRARAAAERAARDNYFYCKGVDRGLSIVNQHRLEQAARDAGKKPKPYTARDYLDAIDWRAREAERRSRK